MIFEACNNISLPLSSFVFARKLSHRNIYIRFAADVLSTDAPEDEAISAAAVSRMLQCRWMNWDLFKDAVHEVHTRHSPPRRNTTPSSSDSDSSDSDSEEDNLDIPAPNFQHPDQQPRLPYLQLNHLVQIPQSLLRGPWTNPTIDFLRYLIYSGARIDWSSSSRGETAIQGLLDALSNHKPTVVALLCCPAVNAIPDTLLLRQAVMDYNCNTTSVFYLLAAAVRAHITSRTQGSSPPDVNFRDAPLWSWAGRLDDKGDWRGKWLKEALRFAVDMAGRSIWDEETFREFKRVVGREEDGVVEVLAPVVEVRGE